MRQMKLGLFLAPGGHHMAAWRHPQAYPAGFSIKSYMSVAQTAERFLPFRAADASVGAGHGD